MAITEHMMEHAANTLGVDPLEFRLKNLLKDGDFVFSGPDPFKGPNRIPDIIEKLKTACSYDQRVQEVNNFNQV